VSDGIRLGGAYYEISADSASLIQALARAEAQSKKSTQAIAQATGIPEKAVAQYAATLIREEKRAADASAQSALRIIKAHNDAAAAADAAARKIAASSQQAGAGFLSVAKGAAGFAAAAVGVATGAAAINAAMSSVAESTKKAADAQFAINKLYGASAPLVTQQAEALAKLAGRSNTEAKEAAASVATLGRSYALSGEQIQTVLRVTADLAAVRGIGLAEASERVAGAVRGEAEAIEYLGQSLQSDFLKATAAMTDEQRKQFETLSPLTKAQIVLNALTKDTADLQGAAAEKAATATGAFSELDASINNLSVSIGSQLAPGLAVGARAISGVVVQVDALVKSLKLRELSQGLRLIGAFATLSGQNVLDTFNVIAGENAAPDAPYGPTLTPDIAQAAQDDVRRRQREAAAQQDAIKAFAAQRKRQIQDVAEAEEQAARRAADAEDKRIERVKVALEVEKDARLKALAERERSTIKAIEAEAAASKKASEEQIEQLELEKKARLDAAEAARDAALAAIAAREKELDVSRELEDRARENERRAEDRQTEDERRVEDRVREQANDREIKRLEDLRDARVAAIEDDIEAFERATEKKTRNIDKQEASARSASDKAIRRIERQADAEDERHRKVMQALDDERDARLDALDIQLRALDAAEKAEGSARRIADLQRRASTAAQAAQAARGTGTPEQIAEARGDLTRAIRVGDPVSVANAQERLKQLAGQGAEAIKKADQELADAQQELRDEGVDNARDAERQKLKDAQDAIRKEIDDRKRAADEENRRRRQDVEDDKRAEQDKLRTRLDALAKKKQQIQDDAREELRLRRNGLEEEKRASQDEIQIARDRFNAETQVLNDRRREADRYREDQRRAQDQLRQDERRAEDEALRLQAEATRKAFEQERTDADAHYNGPNGVLTIVRKAQEAAAQAYRDRINGQRELFDAEKDQINLVYRNPEKTGLLDLQDQAAQNNRDKLGDQLAALSSWKDQANRWVEEQTGKWKTLQEAIEATTNVIRNRPLQATPTINPQGGVGDGDYGPSNPDGGGAGSNPPPAVQPSPSPGIGSDTSDEVDVDPGRFNVAFGFNQPYTNPFNPAIPNHRGVDLVIAGARDGGRGMPVGAFRPGTVVAATIDPNGGNGIIIAGDDGKYHRYFHFDELNVRPGQSVRRGQRIGILGASGTEGFPHLHYEVSRGINGDPQDELIDPRPYMRDAGYLFRHPTLTYTPATGERNMIAERRPEMLLGGAATAGRFDRSPLVGGMPTRDHAAMGASLAAMAQPSAAGATDVSTVNFYGLTYEEAEVRQRRQQRTRSLLLGARRIR